MSNASEREHWAEMGRAGGLKRAARLSPERRSEIARLAARARWRRKPRGLGRTVLAALKAAKAELFGGD